MSLCQALIAPLLLQALPLTADCAARCLRYASAAASGSSGASAAASALVSTSGLQATQSS